MAVLSAGKGEFKYNIHISNKIPKNVLNKILSTKNKVLIITDSGVPKQYLKSLKKDINTKNQYSLILAKGEISKSFKSYQKILNKLIEEHELKADAERVKKLIEERSKNYKEPEKVVNWYYSNEEQLKNIESLALEEQVTELLEKEGKSTEENMDFDKVLGINV